MRQMNLSMFGITILSLLAIEPDAADTMSAVITEQETVKKTTDRTKKYGRKIEVVHHGR
jgi:hypothetical protein